MDEVSGTSVQEQTDKDAAQEHRPNFAPRRSEYWRSLPVNFAQRFTRLRFHSLRNFTRSGKYRGKEQITR